MQKSKRGIKIKTSNAAHHAYYQLVRHIRFNNLYNIDMMDWLWYEYDVMYDM